MRLLVILILLGLASPLLADRGARQKRDAAALEKGLVLHEWGVVLYQQGFEEGRLENASDKPADLPDFIDSWDKLAAKKPVENAQPGVIQIDPFIYLYTKTPQNLTLTVSCPRGLITEWYPSAFRVFPVPGQLEKQAAVVQGGGMITWRNFDTGPLENPQFAAAPDKTNWPALRQTDSSPVSVNGQVEKFLFYRGIMADAAPLIKVEGGANQKFTLTNTSRKETPKNILLINVSGGSLHIKSLDALAPGQKQQVDVSASPDTKQSINAAGAALTESLEEAGLFPKEAAGMMRIWRKGLFETDGVRLIYLNPPSAAQALLPMSVAPPPAGQVRVLMTIIECLRDSKENVVKALVEQLASGTFARRREAQKKLIELGPIAEKELKAALETARDEEVRNSIEVILQKLKPAAGDDAPPSSTDLQ